MGCSINAVVLLTILFIILKLAGAIAWSWVWVLAPLWMGAILAIVLVVIITLGVLALWN